MHQHGLLQVLVNELLLGLTRLLDHDERIFVLLDGLDGRLRVERECEGSAQLGDLAIVLMWQPAVHATCRFVSRRTRAQRL